MTYSGDYIEVLICQNDDLGNETKKAWAIDFQVYEETFLRLETIGLIEGEPCISGNHIIEMYGARVKYEAKSDWVGNMKWNFYRMPTAYGLGLLQLVQQSKKWQASEGWADILQKFDSGDAITGFDLDLSEDFQPIIINSNQKEIFN